MPTGDSYGKIAEDIQRLIDGGDSALVDIHTRLVTLIRQQFKQSAADNYAPINPAPVYTGFYEDAYFA